MTERFSGVSGWVGSRVSCWVELGHFTCGSGWSGQENWTNLQLCSTRFN